MILHTDLETIPKYTYPIVTMGNFDGVHEGHKKILQKIVDHAKVSGGTSIVLTYWPHTKVHFGIIKESDLLQTLEERLESFNKLGVDVVIVCPFSTEFANTPAEVFIEKILIEKIGTKEIVVGYDSVFGKDKKGDKALLDVYSKQGNFSVFQVEPLVDNTGEIISSTRQRNLE